VTGFPFLNHLSTIGEEIMRLATIAVIAAVAVSASAWPDEQPLKAAETTQPAEKIADENAVRNALEQYFKAMRERDASAIEGLLRSPAIAVEVSRESAGVELVDRSKHQQLLPPEGNKDWEKLALSDVTVQISPTHPAVAMVSFVLAKKLSEQEVQGMKAALAEQKLVKITKEQRTMLESMLQKKRLDNVMFALMGKDSKDRGRWKIIAMTFPR
jgi:hypothetical protein